MQKISRPHLSSDLLLAMSVNAINYTLSNLSATPSCLVSFRRYALRVIERCYDLLELLALPLHAELDKS